MGKKTGTFGNTISTSLNYDFLCPPALMPFVCRRLSRQNGMTDRIIKFHGRPQANEKEYISVFSVPLW
jgi:hypothetical protein